MAHERWSRLAPLSGLLFVVVVLVGGPVVTGSTPGAHATASHVIAFYTAHRARERAGVILVALSMIPFVAFAAALRARWRTGRGAEGLSALMLAAAVLAAAGVTVNEGVGYALTDGPSRLSASTAETLNLLSHDLVLTTATGMLSFGVVSGLLVLRARVLPTWLGWSAVVAGLLFVTPIEVVGFAILVVWTSVVAVLLAREAPAPYSSPLSPGVTTPAS